MNADTPRAEVLSEDPFHLRLYLPGTPASTNALLGASYWKKHKNRNLWHLIVKVALGPLRIEKPIEKAQIKIIRHSSRALDYDGCVASMKPVVDALVEYGILLDDRWSVTGKWDVDQAFRKAKDGSFIELEIMEVKDVGKIS